MEICRVISNQECVEYRERGIVCPSQLQGHVFTIPAFDNLDHNLTSATAQILSYGPTISIFQHSTVPISSQPFPLNTTKRDRRTKLSLPESLTEVRPTPEVKPEPPEHTSEKFNSKW